MTLVEILVVISIIAVLAAVGFPMVTRMREAGKSAVCVGNVKQVGAALIMYSVDHNNSLLPLEGLKEDGSKGGDIWPMILAKAGYLWDTPNVGRVPCGTGVWTCPASDFRSNAYGGYGVVEEIFKYETAGVSPPRTSDILRPSSTWLIGDVMENADPKKGWYALRQSSANWATSHGPAVGRHGKSRINVCMFDGHVEPLTVKELKNGKYAYPDKATAP